MFLQLTKRVSAAMLLSCIALFLTTTGFAQTTTTYTAVANGNYTSAATWQGGNKPPSHIGTGSNYEVLVIPNGITVTLDTNLIFSTRSRAEIHGSLIGLPGYYFAPKNYLGNFTGNSTGVVNVDSIYLHGSSTHNFKGNLITNTVQFYDFWLRTGTLTVNKKIHIPNATDSKIYTMMNIGNHCTIIKRGWSSLRLGVDQGVSGVINYPDTMNIIHNPMAFTGHANLDLDTNWFLKHIDTFIINIDSNAAYASIPTTFTIKKDIYFDGTMIFQSGYIRLNQHKLTFGPNAKLYTTPIWGGFIPDNNSEIEVQSDNLDGGVYFYRIPQFNFRSDTLKNFTVNTSSSAGKVIIGDGMTVSGTLDMKKGQLHIRNKQLRLQSGTSATITNAGPNSYITSELGGALHMDVAASATKTFPVGTASHYAPVSVKNNSTASDIFKASVVGEILDSATKGLSVSNGEPVVAATWVVDQTAISGANADITFMWPTAMEVNSFDRTMSYLSRFDDNTQKWDTQPTPSAATQSGNFYTHTLSTTNFDAFNDDYFAVFDNHTSLANLSVNSLTANNKITLYPNPTTGNATIAMKLDQTQTIAITLTDVSGRAVYNKAAMQYSTGNHAITLPTGSLNSGLYFVQLTNERGTVLNSGKLIKQ